MPVDYGPAVLPDRRQLARRDMPTPVRQTLEQLRALLRAPGATTRNGKEWRTIDRRLLESAILAISCSWKAEP